MNTAATESALDVAYWFMDKSVDERNIPHLLFLAQAHYAVNNDTKYLMPCIFICDESGFAEPSVSKVTMLGKPISATYKIDKKTEKFLEEILSKYGKVHHLDLVKVIKNSPVYKKLHREGAKSIVQLKSIVDNFNYGSNIMENNERKVTFSQNGPVVVVPWKPRKV
jgi:hypothetical protein